MAAAARIISEAVEAQKLRSTAALPALEAHFAGKVPPALSPENTFLNDVVKDAAVYYGQYLKQPQAEQQ